MFGHLGYYPQGGGKGEIGMCVKPKLQMKALFTRCGGNILAALDNVQTFYSFSNIHVPNVVNDRSSSLFGNFSILFDPKTSTP
jgi:hypothetical protein